MLTSIIRNNSLRINLLPIANLYCTDKKIPKNLLADTQTAHLQPHNGDPVDKKPFKMDLKEGETYSWCLCGKSKKQPFCDGAHKTIKQKMDFRPIRFKVEKTGSYWLCMCKATKHRPFCDGTHKHPDIQASVR